MKRTKLPNALEIYENNPAETAAAYAEIWQDRLYLQHGITVRDGDCIFDIGAHIGLATLFFHHLAKGIRVFAFEPAPATFQVLKANIELHGVNARLFNIALSKEIGTGLYTFYPECAGMSGLYGDAAEEIAIAAKFLENKGVESEDAEYMVKSKFRAETVRVPVSTLSEIIRTEQVERIDLLKLDVEKSEADVLAGSTDADWEKVRQFVAEVHDVDNRVAGMIAIFEKRGFRVVRDQDPTLVGTPLYTLYATR